MRKLLASGFWLLASGFWLLAAILRPTPKTVYRYPFTVYRPSHRMTRKILTHGSRSTVNGYTVSDEIDAR